MVFQQFELLGYLTALENILLPFHLAEQSPAASDFGRAQNLAERMGVAHTLQRRPEKLSQGERQRVAICRALIAKPQLVICDEPTGNLDPSAKLAAMDLLFEQVAKDGATLLMVTHDHGLLERFAQVIDMGSSR
jgi:putative ABC transport system ATP-binding protein